MTKVLKNTAAGYTESEDYRCLENLQRSFASLFPVYIGWENNNPSHLFEPTERDNHVLHFVTKGRGRLILEDGEREVGMGDVFYIAPGMKAGYVADGEKPWSYVWIGYNGVRAQEYSRLAGFSEKQPVRKSGFVDKVANYIEEALNAHTMTTADELHREAVLMEIFAILIRENEEGSAGCGIKTEEPDFVQRSLDYISQNFDRNIRINDLANYLGVSRSYLSSSFKKSVGCSPQNYILNLRMERARNLLRSTSLPVNLVADSVGYEDQLAFSKAFKQYYGLSPRDYRKGGQELRVFEKKGDFVGSKL